MVHVLQLGTDGEHQFYPLFLGHFFVDADLADGIDNAYALVDDAYINVIALVVQGHGYRIYWRVTDLR